MPRVARVLAANGFRVYLSQADAPNPGYFVLGQISGRHRRRDDHRNRTTRRAITRQCSNRRAATRLRPSSAADVEVYLNDN
jgi:hypothetical protein